METRSVSEEEAANRFASLTRRVTIYGSKRLTKSQRHGVTFENRATTRVHQNVEQFKAACPHSGNAATILKLLQKGIP